jgi:hypothetical protein
MSSPAAPTESNETRLWRVLGFYHGFSLMGFPEEIARKLWLKASERDFMLSLLRPLECMLRGLIFLRAALLPPEPPRPERKQRPRKDLPATFGAPFNTDHPESWRTKFALERRRPNRHLSPTPKHAGAAPAHRSPPRFDADGNRLHSAAPIALRLEALIRGFNDPAPLAKELARALHAESERAEDFAAPLPKQIATHPLAPPIIETRQLCAALVAAKTDSS